MAVDDGAGAAVESDQDAVEEVREDQVIRDRGRAERQRGGVVATLVSHSTLPVVRLSASTSPVGGTPADLLPSTELAPVAAPAGRWWPRTRCRLPQPGSTARRQRPGLECVREPDLQLVRQRQQRVVVVAVVLADRGLPQQRTSTRVRA